MTVSGVGRSRVCDAPEPRGPSEKRAAARGAPRVVVSGQGGWVSRCFAKYAKGREATRRGRGVECTYPLVEVDGRGERGAEVALHGRIREVGGSKPVQHHGALHGTYLDPRLGDGREGGREEEGDGGERGEGRGRRAEEGDIAPLLRLAGAIAAEG